MTKNTLYLWFGLLFSAALYYYFSRNVYAPDTSLALLTFQDKENTKLNLDHFSDQAVVVHFFAAWCGPCMQELPHLNEAYSSLEEKGIQLIGLTDDNPATLDKVVQRFNLLFPVYELDGSLRKNGVPSIPTTFVVNAQGKVTYSLAGVIDWADPEVQNEIILLANSKD